MTTVFCTSCATEMSDQAIACPSCGHPNRASAASRSRILAIVLALLTGGFGIHKFYTGKVGLGVLYLVFFWTFVPAIIAFFEGLIWAFQTDQEWATKQGVTAA